MSTLVPPDTVINKKFFIWTLTVNINKAKINFSIFELLLAADDSNKLPNATLSPFTISCGQTVDNSAQIIHRLSNIYGNEELSDITLSVNDSTYYAHKLVLCIASEVFKVMLTRWDDKHSTLIKLVECEECALVFEDFLKYLYTGRIVFNHDNVLYILMLADKYCVTDLAELCLKFMTDHLVVVVEKNRAISWLMYTYRSPHSHISDTFMEFIKSNFPKVVFTQDFSSLDFHLLLDLLSSSQLVIHDETFIIRVIVKWLILQEKCTWDKAYKLLKNIRFPMLSSIQLSELVKDPLMSSDLPWYEEFLPIISACRDYHLSGENDRHHGTLNCVLTGSMLTPRYYMNEKWITSLTVDNFASMPSYTSKAMVFSTPLSNSEADQTNMYEWVVELFPKGVQYKKCVLLGLWRNMEVNGATYNIVRMTLTLKSNFDSLLKKVNRGVITVLIKSCQDQVEYIKFRMERRIVLEKDCIYHLDDIVPFADLQNFESEYLHGQNNEKFTIYIFIRVESS